MVRRAAFEKAGQFSTDYFMYSDDLSLCYRIVQIGHRNYYTGAAEIMHHVGKSSSRRDWTQFAEVLMRESRCRFFQVTRGPTYGFYYRLSIGISAIVRMVLLSIPMVAWFAGISPSIRNAYHKWWSIFAWALGRRVQDSHV